MSEPMSGNIVGPKFYQRPFFVLAGLLMLQVGLFYPTYWSMVEIWWRSDTFAHGFFIFPIAAYLIWEKRQQLAAAELKYDFRALLPLAGLSFLWLLANAVDVIVVQQFAAVLMLPVLIWLMIGFRATSIIAFPLAFLLLAVPFGEFLVYPLMEFTATFTVHAVRAVGIPVFWEGMYFTLPTGSWSVVEACSGFRYILASLTLGALYAYLTYNSFWRRAAFMLLALLVPIVANGIRAFMIVMIGHFSGMELAVGVDHLIYGWVWFGIVMFAMFWIGSFWQEKKPQQASSSSTAVSKVTVPGKLKGAGWTFASAVVVLLLPVWLVVSQSGTIEQTVTLQLPPAADTWRAEKDSSITQWQPIYKNASQEIESIYSSGSEQVGLHVAYFGSQRQGAELVNRGHRLLPLKNKYWKDVSRTTRHEIINGVEIGLIEARITSPQQSLLVWQWKYLNGARTSNDFYLKALEAWAKLTSQPSHGAAIIVYQEYDEHTKDGLERATQQLRAFVTKMLPELERQFEM